MQLTNEESFAKRWPEFFQGLDLRLQVSIPDQWKGPLWHLCAAIEWELRKVGRPLGHFKIHQIKNKFNALRFYCSMVDDDNELDRTIRAIYSLVSTAQQESRKW